MLDAAQVQLVLLSPTLMNTSYYYGLLLSNKAAKTYEPIAKLILPQSGVGRELIHFTVA
jgi:hypothetical protein